MTSKPTIRVLNEGWEIVLPFDPVPAARARVGRWGTYYPKRYADWKKRAETGLKSVITSFQPTDENVFTSVEVVRKKPKSTKLVIPSGDIDNYVKSAFDAITASGKIWLDDKQVETVWAGKRWTLGSEQPYMRILVGLTMGAIWDSETAVGEDVYDLPWFMRETRRNI